MKQSIIKDYPNVCSHNRKLKFAILEITVQRQTEWYTQSQTMQTASAWILATSEGQSSSKRKT